MPLSRDLIAVAVSLGASPDNSKLSTTAFVLRRPALLGCICSFFLSRAVMFGFILAGREPISGGGVTARATGFPIRELYSSNLRSAAVSGFFFGGSGSGRCTGLGETSRPNRLLKLRDARRAIVSLAGSLLRSTLTRRKSFSSIGFLLT